MRQGNPLPGEARRQSLLAITSRLLMSGGEAKSSPWFRAVFLLDQRQRRKKKFLDCARHNSESSAHAVMRVVIRSQTKSLAICCGGRVNS